LAQTAHHIGVESDYDMDTVVLAMRVNGLLAREQRFLR